MDPVLWGLYIEYACRQCGLVGSEIHPGLAGTFPTFIVAERWAVKLFGRLFDGATTYITELEAASLLQAEPSIPSAAIVAHGQLFDGASIWSWPYLVFEFIPGSSIGEVYGHISLANKITFATQFAEIIRRIHSLPLSGSPVFKPDWQGFSGFAARQSKTCSQIHRARGVLSTHLVNQIDAYLPPVEELVNVSVVPHLIHADLTRDHVLGRIEDGSWHTLGLIDFGDAMVGNLAYELVALHLDLFNCDKRLLRVFLDAYGLSHQEISAMVKPAMAMTLLYPFDILEWAARAFPQINHMENLEQVAAWSWDVEI